ncbi:NAD-dependent epimerase/dehydratase family protein [Mesorhizobium sp. CAU 1732]|uniref:NAD-dependent epimerase/dehydratase family protein n=1 Tax=Mesorhizobium sp. CAU 1732 TaxID=3140358 RepID=UPI003260BBDE
MTRAVLVTGAYGFIGSAVTRRLTDAGWTVKAATRDPGRHPSTLSAPVRLPDLEADPVAWDALLDGVDHVVHCAGIAQASDALSDADYRAANVDLTETLAKAALRRSKGRFIFLSSIRAVTGPVAPGVIDDTTPPAPSDAYGRSKLEAERALRAMFAGDDAKRLVIFQPVPVYGNEARGNLHALLRLASLPIPLPIGRLTAKRSLLHVEALGGAVLHMLDQPDVEGGIYTICDSKPLSIAEIVAAFRMGQGRKPRILAVPPSILSSALTLLGKGALWQQLSGALVADASRLERTGWTPTDDTVQRLSALAAAPHSAD